MNPNSQVTQAEVAYLRHEIEGLREEVASLRGLIRSFAVSVKFRPDQPYEAFMAEHMIEDDQRGTLGVLMLIILNRAAEGDPLIPLGPHASKVEIYREAYKKEPITTDEALRLIGKLLGGDTEFARKLLIAHRDAGFAPEAYAKLDL